MEKGKASSLFVNDGSFMERFKQLQQEKEKGPPLSGSPKPNPVISNNKSSSSGKLAFSLKQKSKLVAPAVKLSEDEEDDESNGGNGIGDVPLKKKILDQPYVSDKLLKQVYVG